MTKLPDLDVLFSAGTRVTTLTILLISLLHKTLFFLASEWNMNHNKSTSQFSAIMWHAKSYFLMIHSAGLLSRLVGRDQYFYIWQPSVRILFKIKRKKKQIFTASRVDHWRLVRSSQKHIRATNGHHAWK